MLAKDLIILRALSPEEIDSLIDKHLPEAEEGDREVIHTALSMIPSDCRPSLAINRMLSISSYLPPESKPTEADIDLVMDAIDHMCIPVIEPPDDFLGI